MMVGYYMMVGYLCIVVVVVVMSIYSSLSFKASLQYLDYEFRMNMILLDSVSRRCRALIESRPEDCDIEKFYKDEFHAKKTDYHINGTSLMFKSLNQFKTPEQYLRSHPKYRYIYELVDAQK